MIILRWLYNNFFFKLLLLFISAPVFSQNQAKITLAEGLQYETGRAIFEKVWVSSPASTTASDGLGPFYNARSCSACHENGTLVIQLDDAVYGQQFQTFAVPGLSSEGKFSIHYEERSIELEGNQIVSLRQPDYFFSELHYGELENTGLSARRALPLAGVGLLEQIPEQVVAQLSDEDDLDNDGISGRMNLVWDIQQKKMVLGRFGWKASQPTLLQQTAKAFNIDMGISNFLFPNAYGDCMEPQHECFKRANGNSAHHDGLEAGNVMLSSVLFFVENIPALEPAKHVTDSIKRGEGLFVELACIACHQPQYIISGQVIRPYTDLLLHDMGEGLSDIAGSVDAGSMDDNAAGMAVEWRTAPLWGLEGKVTDQQARYLHDGRARSLTEAILWHGGEAESSMNRFRSMSQSQRDDLISFLNAL